MLFRRSTSKIPKLFRVNVSDGDAMATLLNSLVPSTASVPKFKYPPANKALLPMLTEENRIVDPNTSEKGRLFRTVVPNWYAMASNLTTDDDPVTKLVQAVAAVLQSALLQG